MDTPLFESLAQLCKRQIIADEDYRLDNVEAWNKAITESRVSMESFDSYRLHKLKRTLAYASEKSPFYRKMFKRIGFEKASLDSVNELAKIPLTSPEDLAANPYAMLCVSQARIERAISFTSSGTTGPNKRVFFLPEEIEHMTDFMAAGLATIADESDVVQILLPEGPAMGQCDLLAKGTAKLGARPVISGMFRPAEEQISCIRENGSTVLFAETHLLYRITKMVEDSIDLQSLGIHTIFVTTSHASSAMTKHLAEAWGARVTSHYGLTEMGLGLAVDCPICKGRHMDELNVFAELINPTTGKTLPLGSEGELVFTTLQRKGMPLIRYRTRDIATLSKANPACPSKNLLVLGDVKNRSGNGMKYGGAMLYPTTFHETLFSLDQVIDYCLSIETDPSGEDRLFLEVETKHRGNRMEKEIAQALERSLSSIGANCTSKPRISLLNPGGLQQGRHFKKIIEDHRTAS